MDLRSFATQSRVLIVAGKGGVGKTTVAAAVARMAARSGVRTLLVDVEGTSALPSLFSHPTLRYDQVVLQAGTATTAEITGRSLTPDDALSEYLDGHGLKRVSKRMSSTGTLDLVATAIPGVKDILVLGKVKQLERESAARQPGAVDLIVVDAPAAGHAVTFLGGASGLLDAVTVGPIRTQAAEVVSLLTDPARCQVLLVTLAEETPVNEAIETAFLLEDRAGVKLGPVVVNGLYPHLDLPTDARAAARDAGVEISDAEADTLETAGAFRRHRQDLQAAQVRRLADGLPLPQIHLPYLWSTDVGPSEVATLSDALAAEVGRLDEGAVTARAQA